MSRPEMEPTPMRMKIVVAVAVLAMSVGASPHASAGENTVLVYET